MTRAFSGFLGDILILSIILTGTAIVTARNPELTSSGIPIDVPAPSATTMYMAPPQNIDVTGSTPDSDGQRTAAALSATLPAKQ